MIDGQHFRIKKNGKPNSICFCHKPECIENYDKAIADTTQVWECHHRLETHFSDGTERPKNAQLSQAELVALDIYFDRPPEEFIFLTKEKHRKLHNIGKKVLCVETGIVFESVNEASRKTSIFHYNISMVCNGKRKTAGGYHWKFV